ncbi:BAH and coiled-coil domain-containing protein 1 isoform X1 [Hemiscyllium ocellatum]|uniref:BAH and coiled-coil domain-containing protein 1 isoform X1 n=1 Tax=Hemiscyllium ocellatum TaxID=170820 RepID=UPI002967335C|nr:BAH and coiled-coil domain-containing protein 1 isoform X1 [Hemiscyllium ocellatum]XP_060700900.1 BAH and coiled-coil domain-containing protein 1 isoform X1 [Hemiscyllium ocellatum]
MDGREFAPPPHLLSHALGVEAARERGALAHRAVGRIASTGHSTAPHPAHFQPAKYFPSPLPMATHSGNALMGNSSATFMGSFLASSLGSAPAHPAGPTSSPSEPAFRSPHSATSQIWFSHSHEVPGYSRFSSSLASTFLPMSHLDHHSNGNNVLYGQHRFYDTQKDGFYLRNLPGQPTLLSTNHSFPSISRATPSHPIGSCSRDREMSHSHKTIKETDRLLTSKEPNKERMSKNEANSLNSQRTHKERHSEDDGKDRHKIVLPLTPDVRCKEDITNMHNSMCENRNKHFNSCLTNSKVMNGDSNKTLLASCTNIGGILPRQMDIHTPGRCTKESLRFERDFRENGPSGPVHVECSDSWQTPHHSVAYSVPSSLSNIPSSSSTASGTFPCLQVHSNLDLFYPTQDKASRELKVTGPTYVPSVGHFSDKSRPFQVTAENCKVNRNMGKEKTHDKSTERSDIGTVPNSHTSLKLDGKGMDWPHNSAIKSKQQCVSSTGAQMVMPFTPQAAKGPSGKGSTYVMPQSQDCFCSKELETCCAKLTHSSYMLDREHGSDAHEKASKDSQGQKVARIRHQHHKLPEVEHIASGSEIKRRPPELSCMSYNGSHIPSWQSPQIPMGEDRKSSYLDPFSSSLQQAAMLSQGSVLNQDMLGQTDEVSAMKSLLKYSSSFPPGTQALIVGQKTPFGGLGNIRASCVHQEIKFQSGKSNLDLERPDCAKGRESESSQGDGEVRQPPVGIAVAVARQKDNQNKHDLPCSAESNRQHRHLPGLKGSSRSAYVIDLEAEEENNHFREERMGLSRLDRERDQLLRENKELVDFARIRPSNGCPGDLNANLMVTGGSSLQANQLGSDPNAHPHLTPPHWLPRTGSPSVWMGGHSYGIGHPALHSNLPPGFPASMPSAMQTVFPLSQDPSAQLVILPTEPPAPHPTPHHLAEVMDPAHSLWPPIYPARAPTSHMQHPGQLSVYPRSPLLRQQELYMLQQQQQQQQQQRAQALELQRHSQLVDHRKADERRLEAEEHTLERNRRSNKAVSLSSPKNLSSPVILPSSMCSAKLSPCHHSPSLGPKSGSPTPQPNAVCALPSCPSSDPATVPQSSAVSPPSQNSTENQTAEKRVERQPPQHYPGSFEPDLPPGYTYTAVAMGYSSPSPLVHSADLADPETMQPVTTAAEPEQSRTFTPGEKIHCDTQSNLAEEVNPTDKQITTNNLDVVEQKMHKVLCTSEKKDTVNTLLAENSTVEQLESSVKENMECSRHLIASQGIVTDGGLTGEEGGQDNSVTKSPHSTSESRTLPDETLDVRNSDCLGSVAEMDLNQECRIVEEAKQVNQDEDSETSHDASERDEVFKWRLDCMAGMDALVAAGLSMGELFGLEPEVPSAPIAPSFPTTSTYYPGSGMHGIALLSELAELERQRQSYDGTSQGEDEAILTHDLQSLATIAAARSLVEAVPLEMDDPQTDLGSSRSYVVRIPRVLNLRRKYSWSPKAETVCPLKVAIDGMDTQELEMRMKLAELQRRYKEKQRELAKLQRRHDHERDENSRSPARRGPGRPRKRKHLSTVLSSLGQLSELEKCDSKKAKSIRTGLSLLCEELRNEGEPKKKKCKLPGRESKEQEYSGNKTGSEMKPKAKKDTPQTNLTSKLGKYSSRPKQKVLGKAANKSHTTAILKSANTSHFRGKTTALPGKIQKQLGKAKTASIPHSQERAKHSTATSEKASKIESGEEDGLSTSKVPFSKSKAAQKTNSDMKKKPGIQPKRRAVGVKVQKATNKKQKQEAQALVTEKEWMSTESDGFSSDAGQLISDMSEDDNNYNSADGSDAITELPIKDSNPGLRTEYSASLTATDIGPSPSSVVKLEANQKAKKKKERQGLLGTLGFSSADGDVKIKKRPAKHGLESSNAVKKTEKLPAMKKKALKAGEKNKKMKNSKGPAEVTIWHHFESDLRPLLHDGRLLPGGSSVPAKLASRRQTRKGSANRCKNVTRKNKVLQATFKKSSGLCLSQKRANPTDHNRNRLNKLKSKLPVKESKGRAVSKLLESFAAEDDFAFDEDSSFSEEDENASVSCSADLCVPQSCTISKEDLKEGLRILIPKEDKLLYAGCVKILQSPDIYSVVIEGERGNRQRIYSLEQLLQEAVLDVKPSSTQFLPPSTRVCAYWSQKSRCLYPGTIIQTGSSSEEEEEEDASDFVTVEFDDGDVGRISLSNIRLLPPDYKIQCTEPSPALLVSNGRLRVRKLPSEKREIAESSQNHTLNGKNSSELSKSSGKKTSVKGKAGKGVLNTEVSTLLKAGHMLSKKTDVLINWPGIIQTKKRNSSKSTTALENLFQLNGSTKRMRGKERFLPVQGLPPPIFSGGFEVDSFSSIANTFASFGSSSSLAPNPKALKYRRVEKMDVSVPKGGKRKTGAEYLVKLDHEGVTSPKTKNGKALLMSEKEFGGKVATGYSQLSKERNGRIELLKGKHAQLQNLPMSLAMNEYTGQSEFGMDCDTDSHSSYSYDEEENRNLQQSVTSRFMTRLSVSSSSSASSSSSTSGSTSTSSLCSSDNDDSSYSSDDDSTVLLQTCMTHPVPAMLTPSDPRQTEPKMSPPSFSVKSVMPANKIKLKRQEEFRLQKAKELSKRQRLPSVENRPKISSFLPARQLWKWSGKPTQRRGMKGKAKKLYYKAIVRGKETICVGDCAVFLSVGRPNLPYIGRIESMWESWGSNMVVKVKWFYHPEETKLGKKCNDGKKALYQSCHEDENDVQTISHKCQVVSLEHYEQMIKTKKYQDSQDLYYLAGTYDPTIGRILNADGVPSLC